MDELHDEAGVKPARAPWRRPSFRILPLHDSEVGVDINVSDGGFTTS